MTSDEASKTEKSYLVTISVIEAAGSQTFRATANSRDEAVNKCLSGGGVLVSEDFKVYEYDDREVRAVEE